MNEIVEELKIEKMIYEFPERFMFQLTKEEYDNLKGLLNN